MSLNAEQKSIRDEIARDLFDAPYEVWEDATQASKDYYLRLADRSMAATRRALDEHAPAAPQYWAGLRLTDYLLGGEVSSLASSA